MGVGVKAAAGLFASTAAASYESYAATALPWAGVGATAALATSSVSRSCQSEEANVRLGSSEKTKNMCLWCIAIGQCVADVFGASKASNVGS